MSGLANAYRTLGYVENDANDDILVRAGEQPEHGALFLVSRPLPSLASLTCSWSQVEGVPLFADRFRAHDGRHPFQTLQMANAVMKEVTANRLPLLCEYSATAKTWKMVTSPKGAGKRVYQFGRTQVARLDGTGTTLVDTNVARKPEKSLFGSAFNPSKADNTSLAEHCTNEAVEDLWKSDSREFVFPEDVFVRIPYFGMPGQSIFQRPAVGSGMAYVTFGTQNANDYWEHDVNMAPTDNDSIVENAVRPADLLGVGLRVEFCVEHGIQKCYYQYHPVINGQSPPDTIQDNWRIINPPHTVHWARVMKKKTAEKTAPKHQMEHGTNHITEFEPSRKVGAQIGKWYG